MSRHPGSPISAADFQDLCTAAYRVYGPGEGDLGYGQREHPLPRADRDVGIPQAGWDALYAMIERCLLHQGLSVDALDPVVALAGSPDLFVPALRGLIARIAQTRLSVWGPGLDIRMAPLVERAQPWSGRISTTILLQFEAEDQARYLFNGAGDLRFALRHSDRAASPASAALADATLTLPPVVLRAHDTAHGPTRTSPRGYYGLAPDTRIDANERIGAFVQAGASGTDGVSLTISATPLFTTDQSGGNGSTLRLTVSLNGAGVYGGGTTLMVGSARPFAFLRHIDPPVATVLQGW